MILIPLAIAASLTNFQLGKPTSDEIYFSFARTESMRKGLAEIVVPTKPKLPTPTLLLGLEVTDRYFPQGDIKRYGGNVLIGLGGRKNFGDLIVDFDFPARFSLRQRPDDGFLTEHSLSARVRFSYLLEHGWGITTFAEQPLYSSTNTTDPSIGIGAYTNISQ